TINVILIRVDAVDREIPRTSRIADAEVSRPGFAGLTAGVAVVVVVPDDAAGDGEAGEADGKAAANAVSVVFRLGVGRGIGTDQAQFEAHTVEIALVTEAEADMFVEIGVVLVAEAAGRAGRGAAPGVRRIADAHAEAVEVRRGVGDLRCVAGIKTAAEINGR